MASPSETMLGLPDFILIFVDGVICTGIVTLGTPNVTSMVTGEAPAARGRTRLVPGTSANPLTLISESEAIAAAKPRSRVSDARANTTAIRGLHIIDILRRRNSRRV